jgi:ubiquinone/menaquinone biosynthesis C-methylase UbiE
MDERRNKPSSSSWEQSEKWYDLLVGAEGHYYHQHVVIPRLLRLLDLKKSSSLLDLGCGQGILERAAPNEIVYHGVDLSPSLIQKAKAQSRNSHHQFSVGDITQKLPLKEEKFTHAAFVLCLQNVEFPDQALLEASKHLKSGSQLAIVLNHPCFRIPRQSSWGVDESKKLQYRRIDRYLTPLKIPIQMHPGQGQKSEETWTFHHSLSDYSKYLSQAGFSIQLLEEWTSDKTSTGPKAKMENRSREEFPLFLTILALKN